MFIVGVIERNNCEVEICRPPLLYASCKFLGEISEGIYLVVRGTQPWSVLDIGFLFIAVYTQWNLGQVVHVVLLRNLLLGRRDDNTD
jgi:hypothetical protein